MFERHTRGKQLFTGYVDPDYARDLDKCRSIMGYVFILSQTPVSWRYILQSIVVLFTTKAEYMALTEAIKEAI